MVEYFEYKSIYLNSKDFSNYKLYFDRADCELVFYGFIILSL